MNEKDKDEAIDSNDDNLDEDEEENLEISSEDAEFVESEDLENSLIESIKEGDSSDEIESIEDESLGFEDFEDELGVQEDYEEELDHETVQKQPTELSKEELEAELKKINRNLIEAALYASGKPLDVEELSTKLELPKKEVEVLIQELAFDYVDRPTALIINQVGEKYQMALRTEYVERVAKFSSGGGIAERYLRTLTVIALKQPILKSLVIKLRGTGAYEHIKYLLDNEFISAVKKGRSEELTTTDKYSEMFGLPKNKEELKKIMIEQLGIETEQK